MELFYDTETSDFYKDNLKPDHKKQSWACQVAALLTDGQIDYASFSLFIKPFDRQISKGAESVHGISVDMCDKTGMDEESVAGLFLNMAHRAEVLICHNSDFDIKFINAMIKRSLPDLKIDFLSYPHFCTMKNSTDICKIIAQWGGHKWPKLSELYEFLFEKPMQNAHDAMGDVIATKECYYELKRRGEWK